MAAALLRLLPRRRATTLAPLIPASMSSYSKPPCPLRAVTAAGVLPDVRRAQLCASPVPSMLSLYASEACFRPAPRQPAHHQATRRLHNHKVSAAATSVLPGSRRMQLSLLLVPTLTRHFSSTGNVLPPLRKLIDPQAMRYLKVLGLALFWFMVSHWIHIWRLYVGRKYSQHCAIIPWFLDKVMNDLREQSKMMGEAIDSLEKAVCLLEEGLDDKAFSMFDQGTDDLLKALAIYEKGLDDLVKVVGSCDVLTLATQEHLRVSCKELDDNIKIMRQSVKKLSAGFKTVIAQRKGAKGYLPRMRSQGLEDV